MMLTDLRDHCNMVVTCVESLEAVSYTVGVTFDKFNIKMLG